MRLFSSPSHENSTISLLATTQRRWGCLVLALGSALAYLWGLSRNQYANDFYAAAAQAGAHSWKAFFYGASDFSSSITVDKPPLGIWPSSLAIRLWGLNSWTIMVPQVLIGLAIMWIIFVMVGKYYSYTAAWLSAWCFITFPLTFIMSRFNNPDILMLLFITLAAWSTITGVITSLGTSSKLSAWQWHMITGILLGLSFLTKQLEGLMTIPALIMPVIVFVPGIKKRVQALLVNALGLFIGAGWWTAIVEFTPANNRPYIGGSPTNDFLQLTLSYNGIGRFSGSAFRPRDISYVDVGHGHEFNFSHTQPGWSRLVYGFEATQVGLFVVLALFGVLAGYWWLFRWHRGTVSQKIIYTIMSVWFVSLWLTFSFMSYTFHPYYPIILATPTAILCGCTLTFLWQQRYEWWAKQVTFILAILETLCTIATAYNGEDRTAHYWGYIFGCVDIISCGLIFIANKKTSPLSPHSRFPWYPLGAISLLIVTFLPPLYYIGATYPRSITDGLPVAGPGFKDKSLASLHQIESLDRTIMEYIQPQAQRYEWEAALIGIRAGRFQLDTGYSVMPIGGFVGLDPSPTITQFKQLVAQHRIHFFISSPEATDTNNPTLRFNRDNNQPEITDFVEKNFIPRVFRDDTFTVKVYDLTLPLTHPKNPEPAKHHEVSISP